MSDLLAAEPLIDLSHAARLFERELGYPVSRKSLPPLVAAHDVEGRKYGNGYRLTLKGYRNLREIVKRTRRQAVKVRYRGLGSEGPSEN